MRTFRPGQNQIVTVGELRRFSAVVVDASGARWTVPRKKFVVKVDAAESIKIAHTQLPFVHAWAITVNKSQGQTCERTLLDLRRSYWEHGQAYTALGRSMTASDTGAFVNASSAIHRNGRIVPVMAAICLPQLLG